jgi:hypothetical protein
MAQHKIRYWDSVGKKYVYFKMPQSGDFEICMCQTDRLGREIWEGDIIWTSRADKLGEGYGGAVLFGRHKRTAGVSVDGDGNDFDTNATCYGFYCSNNTLMTEFFNDLGQVYIVGNIHENPELIKK